MAIETGIGWTDATTNFVIGCERAGPGCGEIIDGKLVGCYAAELARNRFGIEFEPGGERRVTKSGFHDPGVWHRKRMRGDLLTIRNTKRGPMPEATPLWVFACSLSDFADKFWPPGVRERAWKIIRETPSLRWQLTTKRVGNFHKMLPADWDDGRNYPHVGVIATMVNQDEVNRDMRKLLDLRSIYGVKWIGISIEPQLGPVSVIPPDGDTSFAANVDWIITGGQSKQGAGHIVQPYHLEWALQCVREGALLNIPVFVKQIGDNPMLGGEPYGRHDGTPYRNDAEPKRWPKEIRVQQMPRVYGDAEERCAG